MEKARRTGQVPGAMKRVSDDRSAGARLASLPLELPLQLQSLETFISDLEAWKRRPSRAPRKLSPMPACLRVAVQKTRRLGSRAPRLASSTRWMPAVESLIVLSIYQPALRQASIQIANKMCNVRSYGIFIIDIFLCPPPNCTRTSALCDRLRRNRG